MFLLFITAFLAFWCFLALRSSWAGLTQPSMVVTVTRNEFVNVSVKRGQECEVRAYFRLRRNEEQFIHPTSNSRGSREHAAILFHFP
ncbi:hypothetical protein D3875_13225 [Deinococcus cavernae]|uniref:Uncharacterized protein n=1 Tax=Deinococcus cavernae TaxID=2320857 RepID=A0A418V8G7_9DEIO|nr:hypothetical protein D3875_13225 [Deinococcus cavernae]